MSIALKVTSTILCCGAIVFLLYDLAHSRRLKTFNAWTVVGYSFGVCAYLSVMAAYYFESIHVLSYIKVALFEMFSGSIIL
jgi:hypothetical protein